jgi:hypothetical protein
MFSLLVGVVAAQQYEQQMQKVLSQVSDKVVHAVFEQGVPATHSDVADGKPISLFRVPWLEASVLQTWLIRCFKRWPSRKSANQSAYFWRLQLADAARVVLPSGTLKAGW